MVSPKMHKVGEGDSGDKETPIPRSVKSDRVAAKAAKVAVKAEEAATKVLAGTARAKADLAGGVGLKLHQVKPSQGVKALAFLHARALKIKSDCQVEFASNKLARFRSIVYLRPRLVSDYFEPAPEQLNWSDLLNLRLYQSQ